MASAQPVRVARGQPGDEPGDERGLGAAARPQFLAQRTVTTHLTSIFRKLGISARAELAVIASRREDAGSRSTRTPDGR